MKKFLTALAFMPCISFAQNGITISKNLNCTDDQTISQMANSNYVLKYALSSTLYGIVFYYEPKPTNTNIISLLNTLENDVITKSSLYDQHYNTTFNAILADLSAQTCANIRNINIGADIALNNFETDQNYTTNYYQTQAVRDSINFPASRVNNGLFSATNPAAISWENGGTYVQKPGSENPYQFITNDELVFTKYGSSQDKFSDTEQGRGLYTSDHQEYHRTDMTNAAEQLTGTNWFSAQPSKFSIYGESFYNDVRDVQKSPKYQQYVPSDSTGKKWLPTASAQQAPKHKNDPNGTKSEERRQMKELYRNGYALPVQSVRNRDWDSPKYRGQPYTANETDAWNHYQVFEDEDEILDVASYGDDFGEDFEYTQCARPGQPITVDVAVHWKTAIPGRSYMGGSGASYIIGTAIGDLRAQFPALTNKEMNKFIRDATKQKSGRTQKDPCTGWGDFDYQYISNYIAAKYGALTYEAVYKWGRVSPSVLVDTKEQACVYDGIQGTIGAQIGFPPLDNESWICNVNNIGTFVVTKSPTCPFGGTWTGAGTTTCSQPLLANLNYFYPSKTRYPDVSGNNALDSPSAACTLSGGVIINPFANGLGSNSYECIMTNGSYVTTGFESCWVGDQYIGGGRCYRQAGCPAGKTASAPDYICK